MQTVSRKWIGAREGDARLSDNLIGYGNGWSALNDRNVSACKASFYHYQLSRLALVILA